MSHRQTNISTFNDKRCLIGNTPEKLNRYKIWFVCFGGVGLMFGIARFPLVDWAVLISGLTFDEYIF